MGAVTVEEFCFNITPQHSVFSQSTVYPYTKLYVTVIPKCFLDSLREISV